MKNDLSAEKLDSFVLKISNECEKFLIEYGISRAGKDEDELFELLHEYLDCALGHVDYFNYN